MASISFHRRAFYGCLVGCILFVCRVSGEPKGHFPTPSPEERLSMLRASKGDFEGTIRTLRAALFRDLPSTEDLIYRDITFRVELDDRNITAYAGYLNGRRVVAVTVAFGRVIEMNCDALLIGEGRNDHSFVARYMRNVAGAQRENWDRELRGKSLRRIQSPYEFAGMSSHDLDVFSDDPAAKAARSKLYSNSFAFVIAHEVAHHVLGHTDMPRLDVSTAQGARQQRDRETAADRWAIECLVRKHMSPLAGVIPLLLDFVTAAHPVHRANSQDHPADIVRFRAMTQATLLALPSMRAEIAAEGQNFDAVQKQVRTMLAAIDAEIADD
jgi:hypothetical protein